MKRDMILIDSIGCIFNIRSWLNDCIATSLTNSTTGDFEKKDFEQLTSPKFVDNYPGQILPPPFSDEALMNGVMIHRAASGIVLVDGTEDAMKKMVDSNIVPVAMIPAGPSYGKLHTLCQTRNLRCVPTIYRHASDKYPKHLLDRAICIVDDSRATATKMSEAGTSSILLDMPWNSGNTAARRVTSWSIMTDSIEEVNPGEFKISTSV